MKELLTNTNLSHYRIVEKLGAGAMGEVFLAEDMRLERRAALKILPENLANDADRMRRFVQEAKAASALNHPNIITIYEIGETDSTHFIAAEFIEGETLHQKLQSKRMNLERALDAAIQIASALQVAHGAGIVHRDIKPDNVMIRPDGLIKILDFGIAKLTEKKAQSVDAEAATAIKAETSPGMIIGTASYMSPEQARGREVDARTDIFSFGILLYEMLSGKLPFDGESVLDVIGSILHKDPTPLSQAAPEAPRELRRIVEKCLRKDREERYQTAKDLLIDLKDVKQDLEFQHKHGRTSSSNREEAKTQILSATTSDKPHITSSAEYVVTEIKQHKRGFAIGLMILLFASIGLGYWYFSNRSSSAKQVESIAVLPFVNASGNADTEYLSDGMTESLITSLSQLPKLNVKARSSVFHYKGKEVDLRKVGAELSVQAILLGRIIQRGNDLTLYIELVDANTENVLWKENYNRPMANLLALQGEIAHDVSQNLRVRLSGAEQQQLTKGYTDNVEAYQLYLKGQYFWNKFTQEDLQKSIEYYNQAIEKDPNYALAYTGLTACYAQMGNSYLPPNETYPKAKAYAAKALAIDETLAEAHTVMGAVRALYDWNWADAERELKRAQSLNPNYADAHLLYGYVLNATGRLDEAKAEMKRAQELDPLSLIITVDVGNAFYYARQYDQAIEQYKKALDLDPRFFIAYWQLGAAYEQKKMYPQAIAEHQKGIGNAGRHPQLIASLGHAYAVAGQRAEAQKLLDELREISKQSYVNPYLIALIYVGLGDKEQALAWLEKAYHERTFFLIWLKVEPRFDPLRDDPRFQDLLRRIGLPR